MCTSFVSRTPIPHARVIKNDARAGVARDLRRRDCSGDDQEPAHGPQYVVSAFRRTVVRERAMLHRVGSASMDYRRLGSTGLRISRLGLGCGNFGGIGSAPDFFGIGETEAQAFDLMDRAFDAGINFSILRMRTAAGRSETYIGRWLKAKGPAVRPQLLLSSKVFNPVGPGPNDRGLSRRHILQQVDESLARLQTDRLDMYLIHEPDPDTPLDETLRALDDVVRMGKVI
jgi:diketogulonate reductase-like aldo/keto reductase